MPMCVRMKPLKGASIPQQYQNEYRITTAKKK
ncbi:hypothetical protein LSH36_243g04047 [Paralvinella palmiformis]|uniref:Uncharacterized protein n=1 Tax=Paralvinella palmiformis TaxID=53620 RepID=A0AAD9JLH6_9ANNE|nr:hypothetical protein LSH36_243g04047 [Paralvinella palmiformis]